MQTVQNSRTREQNTKLLLGWKQIANYLGMGVRTVQRHERLNGLPIRRPAGHPKSSVIATIAELDAWVAASPIRKSFTLGPQVSSANMIASFQEGLARMRALRNEMRQWRRVLRDSVESLHSSIQAVGLGPTKIYSIAEADSIDSDRKPEHKRVLNLHLDTKGQKRV